MKRHTPSTRRDAGRVLNAVIVVAALAFVGFLVIPTTSCGCMTAPRSVDASNLRQIGQASLIYASDNKDELPRTDSITDFAAALARGGGLNDASIWIATEEASLPANSNPSTVLTPDRTAPHPDFLRARLAFTVVARGLHANLPATTPIAWTRGLQPDGTWSKDSPYGGDGGHIVFLGGNVQFYRNLSASPLARFDDPKATTADIRKALPPDAFIAEPVLR
jgi:hypothetical protein